MCFMKKGKSNKRKENNNHFILIPNSLLTRCSFAGLFSIIVHTWNSSCFSLPYPKTKIKSSLNHFERLSPIGFTCYGLCLKAGLNCCTMKSLTLKKNNGQLTWIKSNIRFGLLSGCIWQSNWQMHLFHHVVNFWHNICR